MSSTQSDALLEIKNLQTHYFLEQGLLRAVDGVTLSVGRGETIGIVGESGCGKSVTARSIMRLLPPRISKIVNGEILLHGSQGVTDIAKLDPGSDQMRAIRGNAISMIFQEPMTSLNPVYTIGQQIAEAIRVHHKFSRAELNERVVDALNLVGIPEPRRRADQYQHEFSGGMRQRAMIAMALACNPELLIADEPTTALDVTIEAQILDLIGRLQAERNMAMILITHDLAVIGEIAQTVVVMYLGKVVETTTARQVFAGAAHPYTQGLLRSRPQIGSKTPLEPIQGQVPGPHQRPQGCSFSPRCTAAMPKCRTHTPPTFVLSEDHSAACWLYESQVEAIDA